MLRSMDTPLASVGVSDRQEAEAIGDRILLRGTNDVEQRFLQRLSRKRDCEIGRAGWPDFLLRDRKTGEVFAVEVKGTGDRLRPAQQKMFPLIEAGGIRVFVWEPSAPDRLIPWRRFTPKPERKSEATAACGRTKNVRGGA